MNFTILENKENIPVLTWLGKKDWIIYKALSENRAISVRPVDFMIMPGYEDIKAYNDLYPNNPPIIIKNKEFNDHPLEFWYRLKSIIDIVRNDPVATFWYYTLSKSLANGPKLFRPLSEQCEALQHSSASYSFDDYRQPYPVIILEIPLEYRNILKQEYNIPDVPKFVLVHQDDKNKFINVSVFFNRNNVFTHVTPYREEFKTIEEAIISNRSNNTDFSEKDLINVAEITQRLGINFAMMMSLYSIKDHGPIDPEQYLQLQQEAKEKRRGMPTPKAMEAQANLAASVNIIKFDQQIKFYDEIIENAPEGEASEIDLIKKSPRSHWRRGHFANQPCGPGLQERKIIFRKPTLVRANAFFGDLSDTSVTYTAHATRNLHKEIPEIGTKIRIIDAEDIPSGTVGTVNKVKIIKNIFLQIEFSIEEDGHNFVLICPPNSYEKVE